MSQSFIGNYREGPVGSTEVKPWNGLIREGCKPQKMNRAERRKQRSMQRKARRFNR